MAKVNIRQRLLCVTKVLALCKKVDRITLYHLFQGERPFVKETKAISLTLRVVDNCHTSRLGKTLELRNGHFLVNREWGYQARLQMVRQVAAARR